MLFSWKRQNLKTILVALEQDGKCYIGQSICRPSDTFNVIKGVAVALVAALAQDPIDGPSPVGPHYGSILNALSWTLSINRAIGMDAAQCVLEGRPQTEHDHNVSGYRETIAQAMIDRGQIAVGLW